MLFMFFLCAAVYFDETNYICVSVAGVYMVFGFNSLIIQVYNNAAKDDGGQGLRS